MAIDPILLTVVGVSTFVALLALGLLVSIGFRAFKTTVFTIVECKLTLLIRDATGSNAQLTKALKLKANHAGLEQFVHRNLSADGSFSDFRVDGLPVEPKKDAGDFLVEVKFAPLARGQIHTTDLSVKVSDSFTSMEESITYLVAHPTEHLIIEIHLPPDRPAQSAKILRRRGGETDSAVTPKPRLELSNTKIIWETANLKDLGAEYIVEWVWPPKR